MKFYYRIQIMKFILIILLIIFLIAFIIYKKYFKKKNQPLPKKQVVEKPFDYIYETNKLINKSKEYFNNNDPFKRDSNT